MQSITLRLLSPVSSTLQLYKELSFPLSSPLNEEPQVKAVTCLSLLSPSAYQERPELPFRPTDKNYLFDLAAAADRILLLNLLD